MRSWLTRHWSVHTNNDAFIFIPESVASRLPESAWRLSGRRKALLRHDPPIGIPDPTYNGTPLGQCLYGSLHGWERGTGDFATTVRLLLDAGERPDPSDLPIGRDDVDTVLRAYLTIGEG